MFEAPAGWPEPFFYGLFPCNKTQKPVYLTRHNGNHCSCSCLVTRCCSIFHTMTTMKFADFQDALRKQQHYPVYFFAGEETCLIDDGTNSLIKALVEPESRDFNFDIFYGSEVAASHIIEIASSFPLLASHRTLLVRDVHKMSNSDLGALASYTARPNRSTHLILTTCEKTWRKKFLEELKNNSCFVECKPLYDRQVPAWIKQEVARHGCTVSETAAEWMATEVGNNLLHLRSEIEKLRLFIGECREITDEDVVAVAGLQREFTIYALQNAIGEKNLSGALRILDRLAQQRTHAGTIIYGLCRYFGNMYMAHGYGRSRQDLEALARQTKISSYFLSQLVSAAERYSVEEITHALEVLRLCEYALKTQSFSELLTLRLTLIAIVRYLPVRYFPFASGPR